MSGASPAPAARPVPTGGAWLGLGIAACAGFVIGFAALTLAVAELVPTIVDAITREVERSPRPAEVPPEFWTVLDLAGEAVAMLRPFTRFVSGTAIVLGVLTLVSAIGLLRGSDLSRRATRVLLVLDGLHTIVETIWMVVFSLTRLDDWYGRFLGAWKAVASHAPEAKALALPEVQGFGVANAMSTVVQGVTSLAILSFLFWLAGRPFARDWCAARAREPAP